MNLQLCFIPTSLIDLFAVATQATGDTASFAVIADPHFYDTNLGTTGEAFEAYLAQDRKMLRESETILSSAIKMIKVRRPDFVLVTGDLTKDGELTSHQKFAGYMAQLEATGIHVLVCPGNHDINNPLAVSFDGAITRPVAHVSPVEFASIYDEFGYGEAIERDPHSLSYLAEPVEGLWVLALDVCKYEDNMASGYPETGGALRPETLNWVLNKLVAARMLGKQVIAFGHHGVIEHYTGQNGAFADYVIDDWQTVSASLANAGLKMMFTGHYHANGITQTASDDGLPTLFDVETGSLVTYPFPVRFVSLHNDQAAVHTQHVTRIRYNTGGVPFPEYAQDFLYQGLLGIAQYTLMTEYGLPADQAAALAPVAADAFTAHYAGDERPSAETLNLINGLLADPDLTTQFLGQMLHALWTDLLPSDNYTFLNCGASITLTVAGTYATGVFDEGTAEIEDRDPATQRLFVVNGDANAIEGSLPLRGPPPTLPLSIHRRPL